MLIDEYEIAERILSTKTINNKSDLFVVAKYLRTEMECNEKETLEMLITIAKKSKFEFNPVKSIPFLESISKKAINYKLKKVDYVDITQHEVDEIKKIDSVKIQRVAFTLLVYAKYNNKLSQDNDNWCNIGINEIYKIARVSTRNTKEKALILNKLNTLGYIAFSKKNTNLNCRYLLIDDKEDSFLRVNDLRELGYQYIAIDNKNQFVTCQKCGAIVKKKSKNDYSTKYCAECSQSLRNENLLKSFHKLD